MTQPEMMHGHTTRPDNAQLQHNNYQRQCKSTLPITLTSSTTLHYQVFMSTHSTITFQIRVINIHQHRLTIHFHIHHINQVKWNNTTSYDKHHVHPSTTIQIHSINHIRPFTKDS
jgi:hypothetical protein